jgi:hypothetical protein
VTGAEYPMTAVRKDDLDVLVVACLKHLPDDVSEDVRAAFIRLDDARHEAPAASEPDPLPDGVFGRIELPGWRNHTGWITDETRFGIQMAVVRDRAGAVLAEVAVGPGCQLVRLAPPLQSPEPLAITGGGEDEDPEGYDEGDSEPVF